MRGVDPLPHLCPELKRGGLKFREGQEGRVVELWHGCPLVPCHTESSEILHKLSAIPPKGAFDCNESGPDGFQDLVLKYDTQEVLAAVEASLGREVEDGELLSLTVTAELFDGTPIAGEDVVVIKKKGK